MPSSPFTETCLELGSRPLAEAQWGVSYDKGTVGPADPPQLPASLLSCKGQDQSFTKSPEAVFTHAAHRRTCNFQAWPGPLGSPWRSPSFEGREWFPAAARHKLHPALGRVPCLGAELVITGEMQMKPCLLRHVSSCTWSGISQQV